MEKVREFQKSIYFCFIDYAKAYNLPVVDLYSITHQHRDLLSPDGVHLVAAGYKLLADEPEIKLSTSAGSWKK